MADQIKEQKLPKMTYRARVPVPVAGETAEQGLGDAFKSSVVFAEAEDMLAHIMQHQLKRDDLIDIQFGDGQGLGFGGTDRPEEYPNTVIYQATIPMSSEMVGNRVVESTERFVEQASINATQSVASVGDSTTGKVLITPPENGKRWALGEKDVLDYRKSFSGETSLDDVVQYVAEDLAVIFCEKTPIGKGEMFIDHVCTHDLLPEEIDTAEVEDKSMLYSRTIVEQPHVG